MIRLKLTNWKKPPGVWKLITGLMVVMMFPGHEAAAAQATVNLGAAGKFAILAKSGISTIPTSAVTGDIGVSPIDSTAITAFSLIHSSGSAFATSAQVTGKAYAPDYAAPTPVNLTTAIADMQTAYTDAAGRPTPDFTELGAGQIGGLTLVPGLYKWGTDVLITTDVTLNGGPSDVWIFQIAGKIIQANGSKMILAGGALAQNIFWQSFGVVSLERPPISRELYWRKQLLPLGQAHRLTADCWHRLRLRWMPILLHFQLRQTRYWSQHWRPRVHTWTLPECHSTSLLRP